MRPPKHIREARKALLDKARADYFDNPIERSSHKASGLGVNLGYRLSPNPKVSHAFRVHFTGMGGNSSSSQSLTPKQRQSKHRTSDSQHYDTKALRGQTVDNRTLVRVGTTPARKLLVEDLETGEKKLLRLRERPRWAEVGNPVTPKDGGK